MAQKEACVPLPETKRDNSKFLKKLGRSVMLLPFLVAARTDSTPAENFISNTHRGTSAPEQLVVMTANVHGWKTSDGKSGYKQFKDTLDEVKPDVVCIQEAVADSSKIEDLAQDYNIAFTTTKRDNLGMRFGNMVLSSNLPLQIEAVYKLNHPLTPEPRSALTVRVGKKFRITNTHLSTDPTEAGQQLHQLGSFESGLSHSYCGDLNRGYSAGPSTPGYGRSVSFVPFAGYRSSAEEPTFPSDAPKRRIDYIFSNCDSSESGSVLPSRTLDIGSDHRGVIAVLAPDC